MGAETRLENSRAVSRGGGRAREVMEAIQAKMRRAILKVFKGATKNMLRSGSPIDECGELPWRVLSRI